MTPDHHNIAFRRRSNHLHLVLSKPDRLLGGATTIENAQLVLRYFNRAKGAKVRLNAAQ